MKLQNRDCLVELYFQPTTIHPTFPSVDAISECRAMHADLLYAQLGHTPWIAESLIAQNQGLKL